MASKNNENKLIPEIIPILVSKYVVLLPMVTLRLSTSEERNINAIKISLDGDKLIGVVAAKTRGKDEFYTTGTVGIIKQIQEHPPQAMRPQKVMIIVKGLARFRIIEILNEYSYRTAKIELVPDEIDKNPDKTKFMMENIRSSYLELLDILDSPNKDYLLNQAKNTKNPDYFANLVVGSIDQAIPLEDRQKFLECLDIGMRMEKVAQFIQQVTLIVQLQKDIQNSLEKKYRESLLREQLDAIKKELGEDNSEMAKYKKRISDAGMPPEAEKEALETLKRLSSLDPRSIEYSYLAAWLDCMVSLPWSKSTEDNQDIAEAERILNEDHYALEKIKERILEFLAIRQRRTNGYGPILCFIGPPGTGKTSIGQSIARAMNRKFVRISLGGVYDEAQIRGHRRTYVGALPGIIIQELKKAGSNNPVFMIDEIDKLGTSALHGDPSSALLEALDPAQNSAFVDHYLNVPFDLSKVFFICTGNLVDPIQPALLDRMEIIEFPGYTREEKLQIAKLYLVPRQLEANGLTSKEINFKDKALDYIIANYTREAGVRNLEREIGNVCRKVATQLVKSGRDKKTVITEKSIEKFLGPPKYHSPLAERISRPGVAIGLAVTPFGGEILFVEAEVIRGVKKQELKITGNVEKIMRESAETALTFISANLEMLGIDETRSPIENKIHIHVPEAATPKDGPSAGIVIFLALLSLCKKKRVRHDVAFTGEITLRGVVLPVGGIKKKILAAKEAGIKTVVLPKANEKDLADLPQSVKDALKRGEIEIKFISEMQEAIPLAFEENE